MINFKQIIFNYYFLILILILKLNFINSQILEIISLSTPTPSDTFIEFLPPNLNLCKFDLYFLVKYISGTSSGIISLQDTKYGNIGELVTSNDTASIFNILYQLPTGTISRTIKSNDIEKTITLTCNDQVTDLSISILKPIFSSSINHFSAIFQIIGLEKGLVFGYNTTLFNIISMNDFDIFQINYKQDYYISSLPISWETELNFFNSKIKLNVIIPFDNTEYLNSNTIPYELNIYPPINNIYNLSSSSNYGTVLKFKSLSNIQRPIYSVYQAGYYKTPRPISGDKENGITYISFCQPVGSNFDFTIFYFNNKFNLENINGLIKETFYNGFSFKKNDSFLINNNYYFDKFQMVSINIGNSSDPLKNYDFKTIEYGYNLQKLTLDFPFGFHSGNNLNFNIDFSIPISSNSSKSLVFIAGSIGSSDKILKDIIFSDLVDDIKPTFSSSIIYLGQSKFIIKMNIKCISGIKNIILNNPNPIKIFSNQYLVSGNQFDGIWELPINSLDQQFDQVLFLQIFNYFESSSTFYFGKNYNILNPFNILEFPKIKLSNINYFKDLINISFLYKKLNVTNQIKENIIFFSFKDIEFYKSLSTTIAFTLNDEKTLKDIGYIENSNYYKPNYYFAKWDENNQRFSIAFKVPANTIPGSLDYSLVFNKDNILYSTTLPQDYQIEIISNNIDIQGPYVDSIVKLNSNSSKFGWIFNIKDDVNGIDSGYMLVKGSIDGSEYNITIDESTLINGGNKWKADYLLLIQISSNDSCIEQDYIITYIYLVDLFGNQALYYKYQPAKETIKYSPYISVDASENPFYKFTDKLELLSISNNAFCNQPINDTIEIKLISFICNQNQIDVGTLDREITFNITAKHISGFKHLQLPIVYLISSTLQSIQCKSSFVSNEGEVYAYICKTKLPIGFGYPGPILISIYGFISNTGIYRGFSSQDLNALGFNWKIDVYNYTNNQPLLTGSSSLNNLDGGELYLYGRALVDIISITLVLDFDNQITYPHTNIEPLGVTTSIKLINIPTFNVTNIKSPIEIFVTNSNSIKSNSIHIVPIIYGQDIINGESIIIPTVTPSSTPIITNPPQSCKGTCGAPNRGYCSPSGCVCFAPNIGLDCESSIITVPPPIINPQEPSTSIPNNNGDKVDIVSIATIVALREINSINGEQSNIHYFDKWIYTNISSTISQYIANITKDGVVTTVNATLEWFIESKNISFAHEPLTMQASSMKYTIQLSSYKFTSSLHHLQIVMSAQIQSKRNDDDICSGKEFGDTITENSNYIKLQVSKNSFYGRYIKRGIVDGRIISVSNSLLDSEFNSINTKNSAQSFIGILVGNYEHNLTIDPDFSILVDQNKANSICSKSKGLSTGQIAGIIVGSVVFGIGLIIIIIKLIYSSSRFLPFKIFIYKISKKKY